MKISEKFERQVARIHQLIDQPDSRVTWNDRIVDPDNPNQLRQIDISIVREGRLTIVECRIHKEKQDVKWIEELMGRRASLKADAVIAVSSVGFTQGAILKAKAHGVILRDFITLSEPEIKLWGHLTKVWLDLYEFKESRIVFHVNRKYPLTLQHIQKYCESNPQFMFGIYEEMLKRIEDKLSRKPGSSARVKAELGTNVSIEGAEIQQIQIETSIKYIRQEISIVSVVGYAGTGAPLEARTSFVEKTDIDNFEITKDIDNNQVSFAVDLSSIQTPSNTLFRGMGFDFGKVVRAKCLEMFGMPRLGMQIQGLKIAVNFII